MLINKYQNYIDKILISTCYKDFHIVDFDEKIIKKYEITNSYIYVGIHKLYRIRATRDIQNPYKIIHKGELGGYIEKEDNLDPYDESWIESGVHLCDNSKVKDFAYLSGNITLFSNSVISDNVSIFADGEIQIFGNTHIYENVKLQNKNFENIKIHESNIFGTSNILKNSFIFNSYISDSLIDGNIEIVNSNINSSSISDNSKIINSVINDLADIEDNSYINNSKIFGSLIFGNASIKNTNIAFGSFGNDADIRSKDDYLYISNFRNKPITFYKDVSGNICVSHCGYNGCLIKFKDTLKFKDRSERDRFDWMLDFVKSYFQIMSRSLVF